MAKNAVDKNVGAKHKGINILGIWEVFTPLCFAPDRWDALQEYPPKPALL